MLGRKPSEETAKLDAAIIRVLTEMEGESPETDEYATLLKQLTLLNELKSKDKKSPVSRDTLITAGANLVGILVVVIYEQKHVWSTKALSVFKKPST